MSVRYALLTFFYCAGIFWLSSQPEPPQPRFDFPGKDKAAHIVVYGGLAATVSFGIRRRKRRARPETQLLAPVIFAALYGLTDEIHQMFVPDRSFELLDLTADVFGAALISALLFFGVWRLRVASV